MKQEDNLAWQLIGAENNYKHDYKFANSGTGHTIYCDSRDEEAPRKCTYRICENKMSECPLFSAKTIQQK